MGHHKIQKEENNTATNVFVVIMAIVVISAIFLITRFDSNSSPKGLAQNTAKKSPITYEGDIQYIDITAKGGFFPGNITAKANQKTILRVNTSNTFDCSSSIFIPKLSYRANLPPTGVTEVNIPAQETNSVINGTCSMGMYRFSIKFI